MEQFVFLRHGETDWNRLGLCVGQVDRPLTEAGRLQAEKARASVGCYAPSVIFSSPLKRALETAEIVGRGLDCKIEVLDGLKEACLGVKEGAFEGDATDDFIGKWLRGARIEGAESFVEFGQRVSAAVEAALSTASQRPLLVAHWGVNYAISAGFSCPPGDIPHCEPWWYRRSGGVWSVRERADRDGQLQFPG